MKELAKSIKRIQDEWCDSCGHVSEGNACDPKEFSTHCALAELRENVKPIERKIEQEPVPTKRKEWIAISNGLPSDSVVFCNGIEMWDITGFSYEVKNQQLGVLTLGLETTPPTIHQEFKVRNDKENVVKFILNTTWDRKSILDFIKNEIHQSSEWAKAEKEEEQGN